MLSFSVGISFRLSVELTKYEAEAPEVMDTNSLLGDEVILSEYLNAFS